MANYQNITPTRLGQAAITTSYATAYTVVANMRSYLKQLDICNTTASAINVYAHIVPIGASATTSNALFYATVVPGSSLLQWTGVQILMPGDTLQFKGSAAGLTVTVSGGESV